MSDTTELEITLLPLMSDFPRGMLLTTLPEEEWKNDERMILELQIAEKCNRDVVYCPPRVFAILNKISDEHLVYRTVYGEPPYAEAEKKRVEWAKEFREQFPPDAT